MLGTRISEGEWIFKVGSNQGSDWSDSSSLLLGAVAASLCGMTLHISLIGVTSGFHGRQLRRCIWSCKWRHRTASFPCSDSTGPDGEASSCWCASASSHRCSKSESNPDIGVGGVKEHHQHKKQHRLFSSLQKECLTETDSALEMWSSLFEWPTQNLTDPATPL